MQSLSRRDWGALKRKLSVTTVIFAIADDKHSQRFSPTSLGSSSCSLVVSKKLVKKVSAIAHSSKAYLFLLPSMFELWFIKIVLNGFFIVSILKFIQ